jgi:hypothetical protein
MCSLPSVLALALMMSSQAMTPRTPVASLIALTPPTTTAIKPAPMASPCEAGQYESWVGTIYYSDPGKTHEVGSCAITCRQFVDGLLPVFGDGATCSGVSGPYELMGFNCCPPRN